MEVMFEEYFNEQIKEKYLLAAGSISVLRKLGYGAESDRIQVQIREIHAVLSDFVSVSVMAFRLFSDQYLKDGVLSELTDEFFGENLSEFICECVQFYCSENEEFSPFDQILIQSLNNVFTLAANQFTSGSDEVQQELERIYDFFCEMKFIPEEERNRMMLEISNVIIEKKASGEEALMISGFFYNAVMAFFSKSLDDSGEVISE